MEGGGGLALLWSVGRLNRAFIPHARPADSICFPANARGPAGGSFSCVVACGSNNNDDDDDDDDDNGVAFKVRLACRRRRRRLLPNAKARKAWALNDPRRRTDGMPTEFKFISLTMFATGWRFATGRGRCNGFGGILYTGNRCVAVTHFLLLLLEQHATCLLRHVTSHAPHSVSRQRAALRLQLIWPSSLAGGRAPPVLMAATPGGRGDEPTTTLAGKPRYLDGARADRFPTASSSSPK